MAEAFRWGVFLDGEVIEYPEYEEAVAEAKRHGENYVPRVLRWSEGGWKNVLGKFVEKHPIDELSIGGVFTYEDPAFDWNVYVVKKYAESGMDEVWWIEETRSLDYGHLQSCRMLRNRDARALYNIHGGRIGS